MSATMSTSALLSTVVEAPAAASDTGEDDYYARITAPSRTCRYDICQTCVVRGAGGAVLFVLQALAAFLLFAVAIWLGIDRPDELWAGVAIWRYCVFFGVLLISPLVTDAVLYVSVAVLRVAVHRMTAASPAALLSVASSSAASLRRVVVGGKRKAAKPKRPPREDDDAAQSDSVRAVSLYVLYFVERLVPELSRSLYTLLNLIAWASLFGVRPQSISEWVDAYFYVNAALLTIFVWALAGTFTGGLALLMSGSLQSVLAAKFAEAHRRHVAVLALAGATPDKYDDRRLSVRMDPTDPRCDELLLHIVEDISIAGTLAVDPADLVGRRIDMESDHDGHVLGAHIFAACLPDGVKDVAPAAVPAAAPAAVPAAAVPAAISAAAALDETTLELGLHDADIPAVKALPRWLLEASITPANVRARLDATRALYAATSAVAKADFDEAWSMLDPHGTGMVTLAQAMSAVGTVVTTRANLRSTIENSRRVVGSLRRIIAVVMNLFVLLVALNAFGLDVLAIYLAVSGILLAFTFVFGGAAAGAFNAVVFHFGVTPFTVGDNIKLGADETPFTVERVNLLATHLRRADGSFIRMPNALLMAQQIINVRESGNLGCVLHWTVDAACTPTSSDTKAMERELVVFLRSNRAAYTGACAVFVSGIERDAKVTLTTSFVLNFNGVDVGRVNKEKQRVVDFVVGMFKRRALTFTPAGPTQLNWGKKEA